MLESLAIDIRVLQRSDIAAALRLKELAAWNQTEQDWQRLLRLEPRGCFCATSHGRVIGTSTTTTYGFDLAWIGMVLVDPEYRKRGIGKRLMQVALDYLRDIDVSTVKLDATPDGRPVYEGMGFKVESRVERWQGVALTNETSVCKSLSTAELAELFVLDRAAFGADRSTLIELGWGWMFRDLAGDDHRLAAQLRAAQQLHGCVEGVAIEMGDAEGGKFRMRAGAKAAAGLAARARQARRRSGT